jgi:hypothetical protein
MSAFGGKADIGRGAKTESNRTSADHQHSSIYLADQIRWDNFKNTLWDSMGPRDKVGQRNSLKLSFNLTPPLGTTTFYT